MGHFRKNLISIFVNESCNMHCVYCPLHSRPMTKPGHIIDLDFAKCGIDDFFSQTDSRGIRVFGNGEPTLTFQLVKDIVEYASTKAGDALYVEMQSNGVFTEQVALWLRNNIDMLWLSLDGLDDVQRNQRPTNSGKPSFATIDRNVKTLTQSGKIKLGLRPTVTDNNVDRQKELVDYAQANGITAIYAYPWASFVKRVDGQPDLIYFADQFLETREYASKLGIYYGTIFMVNFDEEVEINCRALLPAPHLTPDGFVSCCDMVNSGEGFFPELFPELIYGQYDKESHGIRYDEDRKEKIRSRNIHNLKACQGCEALRHCAGGCIGSAMMTSGEFLGINSEYCKVTKYLLKRLPDAVNIGYNPNIPLHP